MLQCQDGKGGRMWWYADGTSRSGPCSLEQLRALILSGRIDAATQVQREGRQEWHTLGEVPELQVLLGDAVLPAQTTHPKADATGSTLPVVPATAGSPASTDDADTTRPGGAWPRFFARSVDVGLLSLVFALVAAILAPDVVARIVDTAGDIGLGIVVLPCALLLEAIEYAAFGNTLGKKLLGMRVADLQQRKLGFVAYLRRNLGVWFSGLALGIPVFNLITMYVQKTRVDGGEGAGWDAGRGHGVYRQSSGWIGAAAAVLIWAGLVGLNVAARVDRAALERLVVTPGLAAQNAHLPRMIGKVMRLDHIGLGRGQEIVFKYTFTTHPSTDFDAAKVHRLLSQGLPKAVCRNIHMRHALNTGWTYDFRYNGNDGRPITHVTFTKAVCAGY